MDRAVGSGRALSLVVIVFDAAGATAVSDNSPEGPTALRCRSCARASAPAPQASPPTRRRRLHLVLAAVHAGRPVASFELAVVVPSPNAVK